MNGFDYSHQTKTNLVSWHGPAVNEQGEYQVGFTVMEDSKLQSTEKNDEDVVK